LFSTASTVLIWPFSMRKASAISQVKGALMPPGEIVPSDSGKS